MFIEVGRGEQKHSEVRSFVA